LAVGHTLGGRNLPNVIDQKTFFLKENDLEKGWYVIFVQIISAYKKATKKPRRQMNFGTPTTFKKNRFLEFSFNKANLATLLRRVTF
jgi:hypothetical protein